MHSNSLRIDLKIGQRREGNGLAKNRISRIVKNYTKRRGSKIIPSKLQSTKLIEYKILDNLSETNRTLSPTEESLNFSKANLTKPEISAFFDKSEANEEILGLKKQINSEKNKIIILQKAYDELLELYSENQNSWFAQIEELKKKYWERR